MFPSGSGIGHSSSDKKLHVDQILLKSEKAAPMKIVMGPLI